MNPAMHHTPSDTISSITPLACSSLGLVVVDGSVRAGFPSPAEDYSCESLDISKILVPHPLATYLIRAKGDSMVKAGINDDDLLVVDKSLRAASGDIVCALVDNYFTVKYLVKKRGAFRLCAGNPTYPDIVPKDGESIEVWGVVTFAITRLHQLRPLRRNAA